MKIKQIETMTEIECSAEELRQSNTLSDGFYNVLRKAFNGPCADGCVEDEVEEDENK